MSRSIYGMHAAWCDAWLDQACNCGRVVERCRSCGRVGCHHACTDADDCICDGVTTTTEHQVRSSSDAGEA